MNDRLNNYNNLPKRLIKKYINSAYKSYIENKNYNLARDFLNIKIKILKIEKNSIDGLKKLIAETYEMHSKDFESNSNLAAASILEQAIDNYVKLGNSKKINELKIKMQKLYNEGISDEMVVVGLEDDDIQMIETEINKIVEVFMSKIEDLDIKEKFEALLSIDLPSFNYHRLNTKTSVMRKILPPKILRYGLSIGSKKDDKEYNIELSFKNHLGLVWKQIFLISEKIIENDEGFNKLVEIFSNSSLIPKFNLDFIINAIDLIKIKQFPAANILLILQMEEILRQLLLVNGVSPTKIENGKSQFNIGQGIFKKFKEYNIDYDEDLLRSIDILLYDEYHYNYRNDIAHGLVNIATLDNGLAYLLIFLYLKIIYSNSSD